MTIKYKFHRTEGDNPFECIVCEEFFYHAQSEYNLCDECHTNDNITKIERQQKEEDRRIEKDYQIFLTKTLNRRKVNEQINM